MSRNKQQAGVYKSESLTKMTLDKAFERAVRTRFGLVTSCVTGRHSNQLN